MRRKPRGSKPTSPASSPVRALGRSMKGMDSDMIGRTGSGLGSSGAISAMRRAEVALAEGVAVKAEALPTRAIKEAAKIFMLLNVFVC